MSEQREHKFKNSYSCKDYWQYYCKNCKKIPYNKYKEILDFIMEQYSFLISEKAMDIKFPYRLGQIRIRKYFKSPKFEGGELVNNLPINYKATKE